MLAPVSRNPARAMRDAASRPRLALLGSAACCASVGVAGTRKLSPIPSYSEIYGAQNGFDIVHDSVFHLHEVRITPARQAMASHRNTHGPPMALRDERNSADARPGSPVSLRRFIRRHADGPPAMGAATFEHSSQSMQIGQSYEVVAMDATEDARALVAGRIMTPTLGRPLNVG